MTPTSSYSEGKNVGKLWMEVCVLHWTLAMNAMMLWQQEGERKDTGKIKGVSQSVGYITLAATMGDGIGVIVF